MPETISEILGQYNKLYKESDEIYHAAALHFGISDSTLWLLYSLYESPEPCTQTDICSTWGISKQTLNSTIKNLESGNYIKLCGEGRSKHLELTESGEELSERVIAPIVKAEKKALAQFSAEERRVYIAMCKKHFENLKKEMLKFIEEK